MHTGTCLFFLLFIMYLQMYRFSPGSPRCGTTTSQPLNLYGRPRPVGISTGRPVGAGQVLALRRLLVPVAAGGRSTRRGQP